jgi:hypothetical protein
MKRCPTCRQSFADTPFKFCRIDGAQLIDEPTLVGDAPTILFSTTGISERFPWLSRDIPAVRDTQQLDRNRKSDETS